MLNSHNSLQRCVWKQPGDTHMIGLCSQRVMILVVGYYYSNEHRNKNQLQLVFMTINHLIIHNWYLSIVKVFMFAIKAHNWWEGVFRFILKLLFYLSHWSSLPHSLWTCREMLERMKVRELRHDIRVLHQVGKAIFPLCCSPSFPVYFLFRFIF